MEVPVLLRTRSSPMDFPASGLSDVRSTHSASIICEALIRETLHLSCLYVQRHQRLQRLQNYRGARE